MRMTRSIPHTLHQNGGRDGSLVAWFEAVYLRRHLAASSPSTIGHYRRTLRFLRRFLGRRPVLADLADSTLLGFVRWRADRIIQTTAAGDFERLLALWRWAAQRRYVEDWPDLKCPVRRLRRAPTAWTPAQLSALAAATCLLRGTVAGIVSSLWWRALVLVGLDTGLRAKQLLQLGWVDVDLARPAVLAQAEWSKTGQDEHLGIAPDTAEALTAIMLPTRRLVFPWTQCRETYFRHWTRLLRLAGLPQSRRDKTQKLRRTCGTWAELVGGPGAGQRILGHSTPSVTARHYLDRTQLPNENLAARFPRP